MISPRVSLVAALVAGCASTPRPVAPPPPTPAAPVAEAPPPEPAPASATPAADPCASGPAHDAIAGLGPDQVLVDPRVAQHRRRHDPMTDLSSMFPAVHGDGNDVLAVAPTDLLDGAGLVALVAPAGSVVAPGRQVPGPGLALLTCRAGVGWSLAARPFSLGSSAEIQLHSVRATTLPGGGRGATVTVLSYLPSGEWHATAFLLGASTPDLPVRLPRAAPYGVLAVLGTVGERVPVDGSPEPRSITPFDATGWYPLGEEQVFVRVARERAPSEAGAWTDALRVTQLARLGRHGLTSSVGGNANAVWLLLGPGEAPGWCTTSARRCGRLTVDGDALADASVPFAWVAGTWAPDFSDPRGRVEPGARWFYAGAWEGAGPPRDPNRAEPLTLVPVVSSAPAAPRAR